MKKCCPMLWTIFAALLIVGSSISMAGLLSFQAFLILIGGAIILATEIMMTIDFCAEKFFNRKRKN